MNDTLLEGTVVENRGAHFEVIVEGRPVRCLLRGKLKKDKRRSVSPVAAGDRVKLTLLDGNQGVIEQVLPRTTDLSRRAAGSIPLRHTLAANLEQAIIVFAVAEPRCDFFLLDRFLVVAEAAEMDKLICFNKCDLLAPEARGPYFRLYSDLGFRVLYTSAETGQGVEELREAMRDRKSAICGPSGVGKSSLLNAVAPGLSLRTGEIGNVTHKGRHTTTSITLLPLPFGGWVADMPGLRQLAFVEEDKDFSAPDRPANNDGGGETAPLSTVKREHVAAVFPDLQPYLGQCRFTDCTHGPEEGCALRGAVAAGEISRRRLRSFLQAGGR